MAALSGTSDRWCRSVRRGARPRRSILLAWTTVLVAANPDLGSAEELTDRLCALAGPDGLAPESVYADRVSRRRERRRRRYLNKQAWAQRAAEQAAATPSPEGQLAVKAARSGDWAAAIRLLDRLETSTDA